MQDTLLYQQQVVRLQALLEATRRIHATIDLDHVLRTALDIAVRELELSGAFFTKFPFSCGEVPSRYLVQNAPMPEDAFVVGLRDQQGEILTELVAIPPEGQSLLLEEQDFLEGLALQTAIAIENAHHHATTLRWQRVQQDLNSAHHIQRSLLPQNMPDIPGYSICCLSNACYEVGGDYIDVISVDGNKHLFLVADVAGKGLASALIASSFRSAFRAMTTASLPLTEVARRLNDLHWAEGVEARCRYVTAIFALVDSETHTVEVVNAGHNPGFLISNRDAEPVQMAASGTPLGLLPGATYKSEHHALQPGTRLLLYTDGLTETFRGDQEFGEARLLSVFGTCHTSDAKLCLDNIWQELRMFSGDQEQADDMSAITLIRESVKGTA